jgi:hypothetical protein
LAAAAIATLVSPVSAGAEVLHDAIDPTPPSFITSQDFETSFDNFDATTADDFDVPSDQVWQPEAVRVTGFKLGDTSTSTVHVKLYADAGQLPGAEIFSATVQAAPGTAYPDFTLPVAGAPLLQPGSYWLSVQARLDGVSPGNPQQWFWRENSEAFGDPAVFANPGNGFNSGCITFTPKSSCPLPNVPPPGSSAHTAPGQSFAIDGTRAGNELVVTDVAAKKKGKLVLSVNAPHTGDLVVDSKQMKDVTDAVTAIGETTVAVKPNAKTKAALADGEKVKAKLKLTLPGPNGSVLTTSLKQKLKG